MDMEGHTKVGDLQQIKNLWEAKTSLNDPRV